MVGRPSAAPHGYYGFIGFGPGIHFGLYDLPLCILAVLSRCVVISGVLSRWEAIGSFSFVVLIAIWPIWLVT